MEHQNGSSHPIKSKDHSTEFELELTISPIARTLEESLPSRLRFKTIRFTALGSRGSSETSLDRLQTPKIAKSGWYNIEGVLMAEVESSSTVGVEVGVPIT